MERSHRTSPQPPLPRPQWLSLLGDRLLRPPRHNGSLCASTVR
jgi:hypothetical protein